MKPIRKKRLLWISLFIAAIGIAVGLTLYALKQNINLFYTPTQIQAGQAPQHKTFRVGGLVMKGSLKREPQTLKVKFVISDMRQSLSIVYEGILPDLFREGQGVIAQGKINAEGIFVAQQVLAKHDEKYMPPEAKYALEQAAKEKS